jgi:hypothetical protein
MYQCFLRELGSTAAAWSRVYAAVTSGITPTLLQQLLPVVTRVLQWAVDDQAEDRTGYNRVAAELGFLLAGLLAGDLFTLCFWWFLTPARTALYLLLRHVLLLMCLCSTGCDQDQPRAHVRCCLIAEPLLTVVRPFGVLCATSDLTSPAWYWHCVFAGMHCPRQQVEAALQMPSSARALESSIRCWVHIHATQPRSHAACKSPTKPLSRCST